MVTMIPGRVKLITRVQADLRRKSIHISADTVEQVIEAYDKRADADERLQSTGHGAAG